MPSMSSICCLVQTWNLFSAWSSACEHAFYLFVFYFIFFMQCGPHFFRTCSRQGSDIFVGWTIHIRTQFHDRWIFVTLWKYVQL